MPHLSTKFNLDVENLKDIPAQVEERLTASLARRDALYESDFGQVSVED